MKFGIGQPAYRWEDQRLLTGQGRYVSDIQLPEQSYGYVLRSPYAHADILQIDVSKAEKQAGVLLVLTGKDLANSGLGDTRCNLKRTRPDGSPDFFAPQPLLVGDRVRSVGDPVAFIVAETLFAAMDAAELIEISYRSRPAITGVRAAIREHAPRVWDEFEKNISNVFEIGDKKAVETALRNADNVVEAEFDISRVSANAMEPRGAIGDYNADENSFTLYTDTQAPHSLRQILAEQLFFVPMENMRVIAPDVGGAFGAKSGPYIEPRLCLWAARELKRPVKWVSTRNEGFQSDSHGRDNYVEAQLAIRDDGTFEALRVNSIANIGAYLSTDRGLYPTFNNLGTLAGVYRTPAIAVTVTAVFTNTQQTAPYRGAGRPEAAYIIEGLIDRAARQLNRDPFELRRKNMIGEDQMPFKTGLTFTYDCGAFEKNQEKALALADRTGFEARRKEARSRGKLRGLGLANAIERAADGPRPEYVDLSFDETGQLTVKAGSKNQGQGHETLYRQIIGTHLDIWDEDIRFSDGDTGALELGTGSFGSRTATIGGGATLQAIHRITEKASVLCAHLLQTDRDQIQREGNRFCLRESDQGFSLKEIARLAFDQDNLPPDFVPGLAATGEYGTSAPNFPNGCHVCEVEIDLETGHVDLVGYWSVEDFGTVINPLTLEGQVHGGIAQGAGQALFEEIVFDEDDGQLLTASFLDYAMPRADDLCSFTLHENPVPTQQNPLGVKGAGEAGTVGALPAVINAVNDALASQNIDPIHMPLTREKIWQALKSR